MNGGKGEVRKLKERKGKRLMGRRKGEEYLGVNVMAGEEFLEGGEKKKHGYGG